MRYQLLHIPTGTYVSSIYVNGKDVWTVWGESIVKETPKIFGSLKEIKAYFRNEKIKHQRKLNRCEFEPVRIST